MEMKLAYCKKTPRPLIHLVSFAVLFYLDFVSPSQIARGRRKCRSFIRLVSVCDFVCLCVLFMSDFLCVALSINDFMAINGSVFSFIQPSVIVMIHSVSDFFSMALSLSGFLLIVPSVSG